ncbi:MFS transporter [Sphaerisporangium melleum]|uniref:MFS transporter n=2 Tax=Sphaerisporangium melleum TaxID=321316 RepID=A0A917QVQ4_9ACTN|nr:MFS transporter [Sphaerisporangium melleum]GII70329.1 MFS transporter [Sphaerisporangium melleum]
MFVGADAVSQVGTQVSLVALPLVAVVTLSAGPLQVGLLTAAEMAAFLLVGLPAGVLVDRLSRRRVLVAADALRAVALGSIPAAALAGVLSLPQLYAVALLAGLCAVFFDVAHMSFLPSIVHGPDLARGNGTVEAIRSTASLAGPGLGGWLVQVVTAPLALLVDAVSYALSATLLSRIAVPETSPDRTPERGSLVKEVAEGVRFVAGHPVLRVIALVGALNMLGFGAWTSAQALFVLRELGLGPGLYGAVVAAGAVGGLLGAVAAPRAVARWRTGPTLYVSAALALPALLVACLAAPGWRVLLFPLGLALGGFASTIFSVTQLSYRQAMCPPHLLGRMNASMRFLMWSAMPFGGVLGGLVGEWRGVGTALWVAGAVIALAHVPVLVSRRTFVAL